LPGWDISTGVTAELEIARGLENIEQINYMIPEGPDNYRIQAAAPEHTIASYV